MGTINQLVFVGDSLTQGRAFNVDWSHGGGGNWVQLVAKNLGQLQGVGPLVSAGIRLASGILLADWSFTGTLDGGTSTDWKSVDSTMAWYKAPFGTTDNLVDPILYWGSGSAKVATWTNGNDIQYLGGGPVIGFAIYYLAYSDGGSNLEGNWSYSTNGGSSYTNMGQTLFRDNTIRKLYIPTAIGAAGTVKIKAADLSNVAAGCCILGIEPYFLDPTSGGTSGLIVHNCGIGGSTIHEGVTSGSGDVLALYDSVQTIGSVNNFNPNLGVVQMNLNDVSVDAGHGWDFTADQLAFYNRLSPSYPVGFMTVWPENPTFESATVQATYRASTTALCAANGLPYLDWPGFLADRCGITSYSALASTGFFNALDTTYGIHLSDWGNSFVANQVYKWTKANFLPSPYNLNRNTRSAMGAKARAGSGISVGTSW